MQKDGSNTWETLKDMKKCYPAQLEEYSLMIKIITELYFAWWTNNMIKKRDRIISKKSLSIGIELISLV